MLADRNTMLTARMRALPVSMVLILVSPTFIPTSWAPGAVPFLSGLSGKKAAAIEATWVPCDPKMCVVGGGVGGDKEWRKWLVGVEELTSEGSKSSCYWWTTSTTCSTVETTPLFKTYPHLQWTMTSSLLPSLSLSFFLSLSLWLYTQAQVCVFS